MTAKASARASEEAQQVQPYVLGSEFALSRPKLDKDGKLLSKWRHYEREHRFLLSVRKTAPARRPEFEIRLRKMRHMLWTISHTVATSDAPRHRYIVEAERTLLKMPRVLDHKIAEISVEKSLTADENQLLRSFLPKFRAAVRPEQLSVASVEPSRSEIDLLKAISAAQASMRKSENKP